MRPRRQAKPARKHSGKKQRKKAPLPQLLPGLEASMISAYADGSSSGRSDEPGGYGWLVLRDGLPVMAGCGGHPSTTNNRMEMAGAIAALEAVRVSGLHLLGAPIELVSDSKYVLGVASGEFHPTKNLDLAHVLKALCRELGVDFRWVRGHSREPWNERCDSLAKQGKQEVKDTLAKEAADAQANQ